mgnify:CR=1 FL=1
MKLAFLGPAPPFRGGIVTYLAMLARVLEQRGHTVSWVGFRAQYPRWLFPGSEQQGGEQGCEPCDLHDFSILPIVFRVSCSGNVR